MQLHKESRFMADLGKKTIRAWTRLMRAHALLTTDAEAAFSADGLPSATWFPVLQELARAPEAGLRPFELERALGTAQYNMSRLVDRIARAGLVDRRPCEDDRRGWRISLTEQGRAMESRMWETYSRVISQSFADRLGDKQIKTLDDILGDLIDSAAR
jgi:DNA-binding MarR family transcriptional regulator